VTCGNLLNRVLLVGVHLEELTDALLLTLSGVQTLLALRWYPVADISVRAFPLFLCIISVPLLAEVGVGANWEQAH